MKCKTFWMFVLAFLFVRLAAYGQMTHWTLPPNIFKVTNPQALTGLPGSSTLGTYLTSNGAFDANGNLLFYVHSNGSTGLTVRKANGTSAGGLNCMIYTGNSNPCVAHNTQDIAIVPVPGTCDQYYVIYVYANPQLTGLVLGYAKVSVSGGGTIVQNSTSIISTGSNNATLAVTKMLGGNRYLLVLTDMGILRRYKITNTGFTIAGGINLSPQIYPTFSPELEVNPNGNRVLFANGNQIYLTTTNVAATTFAGSTVTYTVPAGESAKGLEFNASGNAFYVCTNQRMYWSTSGNGGAMTAIPNSSAYVNSHLEWGKDGFIYVVSNSGALTKMHPTTFAFTQVTAPNTILSNQSTFSAVNAYRLPDQIDGDDYSAIGSSCSVALTASTTQLDAACHPIYLSRGCAANSCGKYRYCITLKNTGNCNINPSTFVTVTLDPRLKVCSIGPGPGYYYINTFGGANPSLCPLDGCCTYSSNPFLGSYSIFSTSTTIPPNGTIQICMDVQLLSGAANLCTNPLVSTVGMNGNCANGAPNAQTMAITYRCCGSTGSNPKGLIALKTTPDGCGDNGDISYDQALTYTIETNDPAFPVDTILDTLDNNFDLNTLQITSMSPSATAEMIEPNVLMITLDGTGEGEVTYTISPLPSLPEGTELTNTAWAYPADANPPVASSADIRTISLDVPRIKEFAPANIVPGCSGPVSLHAEAEGGAAPYTFVWNTGETGDIITVNPDYSAAYAVQATDANGCTSAWRTVGVYVGPMTVDLGPDLAVDPNVPEQACVDLSAAYITGGNGPFSYVWSDDSEDAVHNVCPTATTTYSVTVTDANGCTGTDAVVVSAAGSKRHGTTGHSSTIAATVLDAFPNPFTLTSTLRFIVPTTGTAHLKVYDGFGKELAVLFAGTVNAQQVYDVEFRPKDWSAGLYFARLTLSNGESRSLKLVMVQ